jgi:hypothetical protein
MSGRHHRGRGSSGLGRGAAAAGPGPSGLRSMPDPFSIMDAMMRQMDSLFEGPSLFRGTTTGSLFGGPWGGSSRGGWQGQQGGGRWQVRPERGG